MTKSFSSLDTIQPEIFVTLEMICLTLHAQL